MTLGKKNWVPSKYTYRNGTLTASRNPGEVSIGSRLIADITASFYHIYLKEHCKGKLIDLGCGKAPLYSSYIDLVDSAICVDWPNTSHSKDYLDVECDLTQDLPFQAEEFDTIILSDVLEHLPEPKHLWHEMYRILRPQGKALINVPFLYWIHESPYDYYRYTEFGLRHLAESSGFKVLSLEATGGILEVLTDLSAKFLQFRPLIGKPLASFLQSAVAQLLKTRFGKTLSQRTGRGFPLGYFMVVEKI